MRCLKIVTLVMTVVLIVASRLSAGESQITSVFPLGGKQGTSLEVELRGHDLKGPYAVWFDCDALHGDIGSVVETNADQKSQTTEGMVKKAQQFVIKVTIDPSAKIGAHAFRLVSGSGISNAMWLEVNAETTLLKNQLTPKTAEEFQLSRIPAVVNGRISQKGETDRYVFNAEKGERLRFEVLTGVRGWPTSPPSSPLLTLYEPTSSWLDPKRLVRLAINDESIFYVPQLTYRFEKSGRYIIEVGAVNGQGGPNYSYQLRIADAIPKTSEGTKWLPQALAHPVPGELLICPEFREFSLCC